MNSNFRDKINNYEAAPPVGVWERIVAELDEAAETSQVSSRLKEIEITPPASTWHTIAAHLTENAFTDKLYNIEVFPPPTAWGKIESTLGNNTGTTTPKKITSLFRYAVAASITGFLIFGAVRLFTPKNGNSEFVAKDSTSAPHNNNEVSAGAEESNNLNETPVADIEEARNDAALEASKKTYARLDLSSKSIARNISNFYFASGNNITSPSSGGEITEETSSPKPSPSGRYITLMTPEGNIIRMSKKLGDLVCCISGETDDAQCKDQLKKWREKITASPLGHSSESFMDILTLVNSLQDNNQQ